MSDTATQQAPSEAFPSRTDILDVFSSVIHGGSYGLQPQSVIVMSSSSLL